ncbi:MAG: hypothetical protein WKF65_01495 [Gaiellaceae bacterium]
MLAAVALLAGCGGDDESSDASAEPTAVSLSVSKSGSTYELTAPESLEAGLAEISLQVDAPASEQHDAQLVRVEGEHTLAEVLEVVGAEGAPTPSWLFAAGGVRSTAGGKTSTVTQVLEPGTYYALDTGQGEGDDAPSFAEQGATATFEVTGEAGDAELPEADATVTAEEYSFETEGLEQGVNRILFDNVGEELHHLIGFPYAEGATFEQVKGAFASDEAPQGPPPVDFERITSTTVLEGGTSQITELDLSAGKYAFVCFISNRAGGPPHVVKGMINEVVVE